MDEELEEGTRRFLEHARELARRRSEERPWDEELAGDDGLLRYGATVAQTTNALIDQFAAVATISRALTVHVVAFVR